ncbi:EAL domain-containing protein [Roseateles sp. DB2]|uniref:EAL domain-containing protein n=1 Tax=Roseateles sp. DB2 TaxID=3453717 RepID=UPI003F71A88A
MRQVAALLLAVLLLALMASVAVSASSVREVLQTQLQLKNEDNAGALALALSQQRGEESLMSLLISAQFDTGAYQSLRWKRADGSIAFEKTAAAAKGRAPDWFVAWLPLEVQPGVAQVSDGWKSLGSVEVQSQSAFAHETLWQSFLRIAAWLVGVGALAGGLAALGLRRIREPLDAAVQQANALVQGQFMTIEEARVPELARLTGALNTMVAKVRSLFEAQAEQLQVLQRQAYSDGLTGLTVRKQFLAEFESALGRDDGPVRGGFILMRLCSLADLNQRLGHQQVDQLIQAIARAVKAYPDRVRGCLAGRLNGADLALWLPAPDVAEDTAQALAEALRSALHGGESGVHLAVAAIDMARGRPMSQWFAEADAVLARAEQGTGVCLAYQRVADEDQPAQGERIWRQQISDCLDAGRARLQPFPVMDRQGLLLHWECPLQLQLLSQGDYLQAARWLPLALRSKLSAETDLRAVQLALAAISEDGQPRCVNLAPASLQEGGFVARLREMVFQSPQSARRLGLELGESAALLHFDLLHELGRQIRPLGVALGLEHAGAGLAQVDRLYQAGLDYVKLDAAVVNGISGDASRAAFVRGLVIMLRSLALKVYAEGVADGLDAQALWDIEIDGITGPWATGQMIKP